MQGVTVVINAAGRGSRLGMNIPKSLVEIAGRTVLEWQLNGLCDSADRVRLVVGYMGDTVARLAQQLFPAIEVVVNHDWKITKTAASLSLGMQGVSGRCVSLDGDLLVHPDDFRQFIQSPHDLIGVTHVNSAQPVFALVDANGACREMSYTQLSTYEWTGLVNFCPVDVQPGKNHVFEMIECLLPAQVVNIRCCEIDTPKDYINASRIWPMFAPSMETESTHVQRRAG